MQTMSFKYQDAKNAALEILESQGIFEPPVNPAEIARNIGIDVYFVTFSNPEMAKNISGFYDSEDDSIYVNEQEFSLRQTFTIAHELGHRILHKDWASSNDYKVLLRKGGSSNDPIEKEANTFAAHLLVPRNMLNRYYKIADVETLSQLFAVSVQTIKYRLNSEYGI